MSHTSPPIRPSQSPGVPLPVGNSLRDLCASAPSDAPPLPLYLGAVDALLQWQLSTPVQSLPVPDAAFWNQSLQGFSEHYLTGVRQAVVDTRSDKLVAMAFAAIVAQCQSLGAGVPVHRDCTPSRFSLKTESETGFTLAPPVHPMAGPATYDIACLVRSPELVWEENCVLDICIRYWEQARKANLPVDPDFGEFYRGVEWCGLHYHLGLVGDLAREALTSPHPASEPTGIRVLLHYIWSTCGRYIELKPLMRLIERLEDIETAGGYAFGRV